MSLLSLPRLAKGGIVDSPTVAEIGEDGAEAVIPLEHNTKWIKKVANELRSTMTQGIVPQRYDAEPEYNSMVKAFKEALGQMKIELDDEVAGKFIERTVTRAIYS